VLLLVAVLVAAVSSKGPAFAQPRCPVAPYTAQAPNVEGSRLCPALEVSGSIDPTAPQIDPAFDVLASTNDFATAPPAATKALLQGYSDDGRLVFSMPLDGAGPFRVLVPLPPATLAQLAHLRLSVVNGAQVERGNEPHGQPSVELVAVDDAHVLVAWDGHRFPGLRVKESPGGPLIATATGASTYEQLTINSSSPRLVIDFSDGVRSIERTYSVFGR
jgi:hypothetical protein